MVQVQGLAQARSRHPYQDSKNKKSIGVKKKHRGSGLHIAQPQLFTNMFYFLPEPLIPI